MSMWCHRLRRIVASIVGCAALVLLPACLVSDAVPPQPGTGVAADSAEGASASVGATRDAHAVAGRLGTAFLSVGASSVVPQSAPEVAVSAVRNRDCSPRLPGDFRLSDTSPVAASAEISRAAFSCAQEVGLAFGDDAVAIAALVSRNIQGPLLLLDTGFNVDFVDELKRLEPERLIAAGIDDGLLRYALPDFSVEQLPATGGTDSPPDGTTHSRVWIVGDSGHAEALAAVARQVGVGVVAATGDLRALSPSERNAISEAAVVEVLADLGVNGAWQLEVVRRGDDLPGGGLLLFGADAASPVRRLVAVYGHPLTSALGVLGEQAPDQTVKRLQSIAEGYEADGLAVLPAFEVIATVASASAGADGDYSNETAKDKIRPWVEAAAAHGVYVVLDLQPGRSDFLSQAKIYEEFLRLPHVGLALDPEWRLKPDQVHLAQIGAVDAAEINLVSEWLAEIVRQHALPQKLLVVHQFRFSMITGREHIDTPPELAVLIHMDGQGPLGVKYDTWNALTGRHDAERFHWGWKNFYDEDIPMATPAQVLELSPTPVFVSFQ